jgi:cell division protein FtsL
MEIDVKSLYMTGYIGMVLLNIIGGSFFILALIAQFYGMDSFYVLISLLSGLVMISLLTTAYTTKLRKMFFAEEYELEKQRKYDQTMKDYEDLRREQNNL